MSDGMSDSRAGSELANDVWATAFDLAECAMHLMQAVGRARNGHRGWGVARSWIVEEVNRALRPTGFALVDREPDKSFEHYEGVYEHRETRREKRMREALAPFAAAAAQRGLLISDEDLRKAAEALR
jgi:hypothetical protein